MTKMTFQLSPDAKWEYHKGVSWNPTTAITTIAITGDDNQTDLHGFFSFNPGAAPGGMAGHRGTVCDPDRRSRNKFSMFGWWDSNWSGQVIRYFNRLCHAKSTSLFFKDHCS